MRLCIIVLKRPYKFIKGYKCGQYYVNFGKIIRETQKAILFESYCYGSLIAWIPKSVIIKIIPIEQLI